MQTFRAIAYIQVRTDPVSGSHRSADRQARKNVSCVASSARPVSPTSRWQNRKISLPWRS